jgi:hypothetical protein
MSCQLRASAALPPVKNYYLQAKIDMKQKECSIMYLVVTNVMSSATTMHVRVSDSYSDMTRSWKSVTHAEEA